MPDGHQSQPWRPGCRLLFSLLALAGCLVSAPASAQEGYVLQGILDAELHDTDTDSPFLTRNDGDPAVLGRLHLWAALQLSRSLQFYAQGKFETGEAEGYFGNESELEQFALRYMRQSAPWLFIEAGKVLSPVTAYSVRNLSTLNPLIGQPYLYEGNYPWGAKVVGTAGWLDYQAAWIDPSGSDTEYGYIKPDSAFRPALAVGITPFMGLRFGLSWTRGPYLNRESDHDLHDGSRWRDYEKEVQGLDFQFSRGYLEFNGQLLRARYNVPYLGTTPADETYFLELKYTWTPRLFTALRYEGVELTEVGYYGYRYWYFEREEFRVLEFGLGYRFSPDLLFKVSYQGDYVDGRREGYGENRRGHALALQLSWSFDLPSLVAGKR